MRLHRDANGQLVQLAGGQTALAVTRDDTLATDTAETVNINASARYIVIVALDNAILYRFGATASSANFDGIVTAGDRVEFMVDEGEFATLSLIGDTGTAKYRVMQYA